MTQKKPMSNIFNSFKNCCWLGSVTPSTFFIQSFLRAFISEVVAPKLSLLAAFPFSRSKKLLNTVSFIFFLTLYNTIPFNLIYEALNILDQLKAFYCNFIKFGTNMTKTGKTM